MSATAIKCESVEADFLQSWRLHVKQPVNVCDILLTSATNATANKGNISHSKLMSTTTCLLLPELKDSFSGSTSDFCKIKPVAHLTRLHACGLLTAPHWCSDDLFCTPGYGTFKAMRCVGCPSVHSSIWSSFNRVNPPHSYQHHVHTATVPLLLPPVTTPPPQSRLWSAAAESVLSEWAMEWSCLHSACGQQWWGGLST